VYGLVRQESGPESGQESRWTIKPITIEGSGHAEAALETGDPLSFDTGGDEGFSGWVACEGFPADPVFVITWSDHPIEADTKQVHVTRLRIGDGTAHVVQATDYTLPVADPVQGVSRGPACGIDFELWA
jgi:hypothetical protein